MGGQTAYSSSLKHLSSVAHYRNGSGASGQATSAPPHDLDDHCLHLDVKTRLIPFRSADNVDVLVLQASAIPESGTASVRARPTVKHLTVSPQTYLHWLV